jgi:hypothetical protein
MAYLGQNMFWMHNKHICFCDSNLSTYICKYHKQDATLQYCLIKKQTFHDLYIYYTTIVLLLYYVPCNKFCLQHQQPWLSLSCDMTWLWVLTVSLIAFRWMPEQYCETNNGSFPISPFRFTECQLERVRIITRSVLVWSHNANLDYKEYYLLGYKAV